MNRASDFNFFKDVKKVGFFGFGKSNTAVLRLLPKRVSFVLRSDVKIKKEDIPKHRKPAAIYEGEDAFSNLDEEILFLSPSVRRERLEFERARTKGVVLCSDFELFAAESNSRIIAVSGSDGKSTTATLTAMLLEDITKFPEPFGNVGRPFCEALLKKLPYTVAEISSFTLNYSSPVSERAAVTNITPNHLNWHSSFEEYENAKLSLLKASRNAVISADDPILSDFGAGRELFAVTSSKSSYEELKELYDASVFYTLEKGYILRCGKKLLSLSEIKTKEEYNIKNLMSALALTDGLTNEERIKKVAEEFSGLSHRREKILYENGVTYIDSSIDTTPKRSAATLSSFEEKVIVILGGRGKGTGYTELRPALREKAKLAVITGENRFDISRDIGGEVEKAVIDGFDNAVLYAASVAKEGDTVILSPASTSYDSFESFEKRGEKFKEIIYAFYKKT